jgi:hypothetical protein
MRKPSIDRRSSRLSGERVRVKGKIDEAPSPLSSPVEGEEVGFGMGEGTLNFEIL